MNYIHIAKPLVRYFTGATYANRSGGPTTVLVLVLQTGTNYNGA